MNKSFIKTSIVLLAFSSAFSANAFSIKDMVIEKVQNAVQHKVQNQAAQPKQMPSAQGGFANCPDQFPGNRPLNIEKFDSSMKVRAICFDSFAVVHSGATKTPLVSIEKLNQQRLLDAKDEKRTNKFFEDARLPSSERATLADYQGSGYDRGHMAPAADMPNPNAMAQSFSLANMVPQNSVNNQKIWNKLESDVRKFASRAAGNTFVFTGPIFKNGNVNTIGRGVVVPSHLFKLVYNEQSGKTMAFIVENSGTAQVGPPMAYKEFVRETKMDFLQGLNISP